MLIEDRLKEMNINLPEYMTNCLPFRPAVRMGSLIYSSGNTPVVNGKLMFKGIVGQDISLEEAREAAIISMINCLVGIKEVIGDLDQISSFVKINGYIRCTSDFTQLAEIMNTVSEVINVAFGEGGTHARAAIGVASLPGGSPVEIEVVAQIN